MYINFGSINSRQAADGSCTAPLTVDSCGTCRLKKHASLPTITRYDENAYQLFYIAAGKAHFWFDDAEHVVTAGHMVLYRPQEERRYIYYLEDHPEVFWVYFSGSEAAAVLQAHEIPLDGHVFYSGIMPEYKNTFRRMIQELQLCQYAYRDYTAGLFQMMLVLVSRQRQERRSINGTTREQIEAAAAYFNENYYCPHQCGRIRRVPAHEHGMVHPQLQTVCGLVARTVYPVAAYRQCTALAGTHQIQHR